MELRIDPEFKDKLRPLTDDEYQRLKENILTDGRINQPIVAWNGIIVDGHHRWKIIQECNLSEDWYAVEEKNFPDKFAAFAWMYDRQLGQRNLNDSQRKDTEQQREYMIGKMYESGKKTQGSFNQYVQKSEKYQSGTFHSGKTGEVIAKQLGIGYGTVMRAADYAKGIDAIREQEPEVAESILKGELSVKKADVMELSKEKDEPTLREKIEKLKKGEPIRTKPQNEAPKPAEPVPAVPVPAPQEKKDLPPARFVTSEPAPQPQYKCLADNPRTWNAGTRENMEFNRQLLEGNAAMGDPSKTPKYTVHMMLEEMKATFELYMNGIVSFYDLHPDMYTKENQVIIEAVYNNYLINKIQEMKERIHYV